MLGLIGSFLALWWSSSRTVTYALAFSHVLGISQLCIGFVFASLLSGLPELLVALFSVYRGIPQLSVGDLIGSNFTDISLVIGLPICVISGMRIPKHELSHLQFLLFLITLLMAMVFSIGLLGRFMGVLLLIAYVLVIAWLWSMERTTVIVREQAELQQQRVALADEQFSLGVLSMKLAFSGGLLLFSAYAAVHIAAHISSLLGLSVFALGSTLFALGTSVPELLFNIQAVRKKEYDLALGNSFGSVLSQGSLILGLLAICSDQPLHLDSVRHIAPFMFFAFGVLGYGLLMRHRISRLHGLIVLLLYTMYLITELYIVRTGPTMLS